MNDETDPQVVSQSEKAIPEPLGTETARKNALNWSLAAVLWTICVGGSLAWNWSESDRHVRALALQTARALYEKDVLYREWSAKHGGVYVPVSASTQPNPFLKVPERDITTPSGRTLTLLNPAYMTRQVFELQDDKLRIRGHITSLKPILSSKRSGFVGAYSLGGVRTGCQRIQRDRGHSGEPPHPHDASAGHHASVPALP